MDIQFAYNLERMLYFICNENPDVVRPYMEAVERQYSYIPGAVGAKLDSIVLRRIQEVFSSYSVSDAETLATIKEIDEKHNFVLCPHSATSVYAALHPFREMSAATLTVCVLTAHPSKFEEAVQRAIGRDPEFPAAITALRSMPHKFKSLDKASPEAEVWRKAWIAILKDDIASV
jgi:threonine synthase